MNGLNLDTVLRQSSAVYANYIVMVTLTITSSNKLERNDVATVTVNKSK